MGPCVVCSWMGRIVWLYEVVVVDAGDMHHTTGVEVGKTGETKKECKTVPALALVEMEGVPTTFLLVFLCRFLPLLCVLLCRFLLFCCLQLAGHSAGGVPVIREKLPWNFRTLSGCEDNCCFELSHTPSKTFVLVGIAANFLRV